MLLHVFHFRVDETRRQSTVPVSSVFNEQYNISGRARPKQEINSSTQNYAYTKCPPSQRSLATYVKMLFNLLIVCLLASPHIYFLTNIHIYKQIYPIRVKLVWTMKWQSNCILTRHNRMQLYRKLTWKEEHITYRVLP